MQQSKKKILVADDDAAILDVLTIILEEFGYEVECIIDAANVLDFPDGYPDMFILDIWMSGWNGLDICQALKKQPTTRHLPIILFSAKKEAEKLALDAGADDFLAKPFELDMLLEKVERLL